MELFIGGHVPHKAYIGNLLVTNIDHLHRVLSSRCFKDGNTERLFLAGT